MNIVPASFVLILIACRNFGARSMDVPLDPEIERVVRQKVESGEYPSVAVLIEEALFLLVERDWSKTQADLQERMPSVFDLDSQPSTEGDHP